MVRGVVLAGGGATRYGGRPKGLEVVGGARILDRLVDAMTDAFGVPPLLVANAPDAATWRPGLDVVSDVRPGLGALGGLYTAVRAGPAPVVGAAWDMPFVTPGLLTALAAGLADADACLPESQGRRGLEPLCAAYDPEWLFLNVNSPDELAQAESAWRERESSQSTDGRTPGRPRCPWRSPRSSRAAASGS